MCFGGLYSAFGSEDFQIRKTQTSVVFSDRIFRFFFCHSNKNGKVLAIQAISAHIVFADLMDMALRCKCLAMFSQIPVTGRALWRIREPASGPENFSALTTDVLADRQRSGLEWHSPIRHPGRPEASPSDRHSAL
ncbi:hypothetical protein V6L77_23285 [Pannonibacter sp. Pt2-lr]